jgi:flagellin-like protein
MRGIEPIIAVVILVAVTLVIAIGVIGWIMGWWGTMGAVESLQIFPDSYIDSSGKLVLHIKNTGSATAVIYKVEIVGVGTADLGGADKSLSPGAEETAWILQFAGSVTAGTNYQVKIYTKAGNVYSAIVKAV